MSYLIEKFNLQLEAIATTEIDKKNPITALSFQHAIKIFINKPQVVNKWVAGSIIIESDRVDSALLNDLTKSDFKIEIREFLSKTNKIFQNLTYIIVFDANYSNVLFHPINTDLNLRYSSVSFIHLFQFNEKEQKIRLYIDKNNINKIDLEKFKLQTTWLKSNLLAKLVKWCQIVKLDDEFSCAKLNTLTLYSNMVDDYVKLYQSLKNIYFVRFEPIWFEMTGTDPEKYIHEDISIACYFILVWQHFGYKVKNFVDLGCGNGLLVYILNDQGFKGYGIDMRKRKIWSNQFYLESNTKLIEETIDPRINIFEDCDWLLANHSDELTPWLPIMAFKTSTISRYPCNFLLIPCCFYDFNSKFDIKKKNESRYDTYLNYISKICTSLKFTLKKDKLRIPSTRNVCFICIQDVYVTDLLQIEDENMIKIIKNENIEFKARDLDLEKSKSSRNCTKNVNSDLKIFIIKKVLNSLLDKSEIDDLYFLEKEDDISKKWNAGRVMSIGNVAQLFDQETLNKLKLECGGIKTLLKNHFQMFSIFDRDKIKLKVWTKASALSYSSKKEFKTKQCLFELYHPDGCLLNSENCLYIHSK